MAKSGISAQLKSLPASSQGSRRTQRSLSQEDDRRIGAILVDRGHLNLEQAAIVLENQTTQDELFGALAVRLGFCDQGAVNAALSSQVRPMPIKQADRSRLAPHIQKILSQPELVSQFNQGITHLDLRWFTGALERKCLSFVAANPNEGCSTTVAIIAILLAQVDRRVLVIDASFDVNGQRHLFGLKDSQIGFADALANPSRCLDLPPALDPLDIRVLAGTGPETHSQMLETRQFARLLDFASNHFDVILVDNAPALTRPDAYTVAMRCSGAVTVIRLHKSRSEDSRLLVHGLTESGVELVGTIGTNF